MFQLCNSNLHAAKKTRELINFPLAANTHYTFQSDIHKFINQNGLPNLYLHL